IILFLNKFKTASKYFHIFHLLFDPLSAIYLSFAFYSFSTLYVLIKAVLFLAGKLLKISTINLQLEKIFVVTAGWTPRINNDNRRTLSYPEVRTFIKVELCRVIMENFGEVDAIAGVATGAIAQGALVAETLGLPYVYVRSAPKDHGLENLIEGNLKPGQKV